MFRFHHLSSLRFSKGVPAASYGLKELGREREMSATRERRKARRQRVLFTAWATPARCSQPMECAVRNLSTGGAAVRIAPSAPNAFQLVIERDGAVRHAQTIWRDGEMRGVAFDDAPADDGTKVVSILDVRDAIRFRTRGDA